MRTRGIYEDFSGKKNADCKVTFKEKEKDTNFGATLILKQNPNRNQESRTMV